MRNALTKNTRNSGIELMKIISMFFIILCHTIMTVTIRNMYPEVDFVLDVNSSTTSITLFTLGTIQSVCNAANILFIICSSWFLLDREVSDKKKVLFLILDAWTISVLIFGITYLLGCDLDFRSTLLQFFPTSNSNNWFVTCYILIYLLHPFLNKLIKALKKEHLFGITSALVLIYSLYTYFRPFFFNNSIFFGNELIVWIIIYFVIAYMKLYSPEISCSRKVNILFMLIGFLGHVIMSLLLNLGGLITPYLDGRLQTIAYNGSPFLLLLALGIFNLVRNTDFKSPVINYIAGMSLLIYLFHENAIFSYIYRPLIFIKIYENGGYDHIIMWVFIVALAIFAAALIVSFIYKNTIERLVKLISDKLYIPLSKLYHKIEHAFMQLH